MTCDCVPRFQKKKNSGFTYLWIRFQEHKNIIKSPSCGKLRRTQVKRNAKQGWITYKERGPCIFIFFPLYCVLSAFVRIGRRCVPTNKCQKTPLRAWQSVKVFEHNIWLQKRKGFSYMKINISVYIMEGKQKLYTLSSRQLFLPA